jgi:hypothetical protein
VAYDNRRHPILLKTTHHSAFSCSSFLKLYNCWWKRDALDKGQSPLPDVTIQDMDLFSAINVHKGHDQTDMLKNYWSTL